MTTRAAGNADPWFRELVGTAEQLAETPDYAESIRLYRKAASAPEIVSGLKRLRVGILHNVTVEPWLPELFVALLRRRLLVDFWVGDYGVIEPHVMDDSLPALDLLWVHLDGDALAGDVRHHPTEADEAVLRERLSGLVALVGARVAASTIVSTLAPGRYTHHTPWVDQRDEAWPAVRCRLNQTLRAAAERHPGVSLLDVDRLVSDAGVRNAIDHRMTVTSRSPWSLDFLPRLGDGLARVVAASVGTPRKCVVVDCDNTLWGGVLGEDGAGGLALGAEYPGSEYRDFQFFLKGLQRQGFLLAINSKNNEKDVVDFLETSHDMVLKADDFAAMRINWEDKASNLRSLSEELNIGLDSMVFVDDSPVECAWVRESLPEVQVEQFPSAPLEIAEFAYRLTNLERVVVTEADRLRTDSIRANTKRERLRAEAPDMESFVRDLAIDVTITREDHDDIPRISQLTQRTNQFNVTTRRYAPDDIRQLMADGRVYSMRMKDRFSDYGTVGVVIAKPDRGDAWSIDTFLLSCRAFGRGVESALLETVMADLEGHGVARVLAEYVATAKNRMTKDFFPSHGFEVSFEGETESRFEADLADRAEAPQPPLTIRRVGF